MSAQFTTRNLETDCLPFLSLLRVGSPPLYRGVRNTEGGIAHSLVHRNRVPRNMPPELHAAADEWFSRRFGVRYRAAARFCTGNRMQAERHGVVTLVFPVEAFQFCWSPHVEDLFDWCRAEGLIERIEGRPGVARCTPGELQARLDTLGYRDDDLTAAAKSGSEVMVACRSCYEVPAATPADDERILRDLGIAGGPP